MQTSDWTRTRGCEKFTMVVESSSMLSVAMHLDHSMILDAAATAEMIQ